MPTYRRQYTKQEVRARMERGADGAYRIAMLVRGQLIQRQYYGYTKAGAVDAFCAELFTGLEGR